VARCRDILEEFEARYSRHLPEQNMMYLGQKMISFGSFNPGIEDDLVDKNSSNSLVFGSGC